MNSQTFSSKIHPAFSHLPTLKKSALAKPLYSMYASQPLPSDAKVAIFAKAGSDTLLAKEIVYQMKQAFGSLDIRLAAEVDERELRGFDFLLHISSERGAIERILMLDDPRPLPKVERFGRQMMGLHFLSRGIFLKSFRDASLADLESEVVLNWLFEETAGLHEIEAYRKQRRFFLSQLSSQTGVFVYLHALFKSLEWDSKEIDLCFIDARPLLEHFHNHLVDSQPVLEKSYGIRRIDLTYGGRTQSFEVSPKGKTVRIFCPDDLSEADLGRLLLWSEDFTGISGIDGFSDSISANKGYFYDPATLSSSFVKDLIALAENRIAGHRSALSVLRLFTKLFEQQCTPEEGEWVDESSIQCEEKMPLLEIAERIGVYLQDPDALAGFKKLNRLIAKEHSCNAFLLHMVQRAVCHRRRPEVARLEEEAVSKFILNQIPISYLVQHMQDAFLS